jgi:hypothetical protein
MSAIAVETAPELIDEPTTLSSMTTRAITTTPKPTAHKEDFMLTPDPTAETLRTSGVTDPAPLVRDVPSPDDDETRVCEPRLAVAHDQTTLLAWLQNLSVLDSPATGGGR